MERRARTIEPREASCVRCMDRQVVEEAVEVIAKELIGMET